MVDMGAEVGHKMRSAIKAKLTELDCYVDDELPDYIMVMVANKRTKSQMNEDLNLFLNTKTTTFVDWLHIVLKKLKEVTVTNLEVYKKASKRKSSELSSVKVKKEKRIKKEKILKLDDDSNVKQEKEEDINKSLTDDLPLNVKSLSENRKILLVPNIMSEENMNQKLDDRNFDIPSVSEVDQSNLTELEEIENQIKSVKSRLGLKVDDDVEEAELRRLVESSRNKPKEQLSGAETSILEEKFLSNGRHVELDTSKTLQVLPEKEYSVETETTDWTKRTSNEPVCLFKKEHSRIVFSKNDSQFTPNTPPRKKSVLDRLGKFNSNNEKSVLDRLGKYNESTDCKNLNEMDHGAENSFRKESSSEDKKDNRKDDEDYYLGKMERHYLQRKDADDSNTNTHHPRKEQFDKRDSVKFRTKDSSFRRSRDDLRKYLLKSAPSENLRKDLKKRLGLSSKVTVPQTDPQLLEDTFKKREVVSVVRVKPRILPPNLQQANKNLLLKAVADAQKSVAQSKPVGNNLKEDSAERKYKTLELENPPPVALYTKQFKSIKNERKIKKISVIEKEKLRCLLSSHVSSSKELSDGKKSDQEYIPEPVKHSLSSIQYVPSGVNTKKNEGSSNYIGEQHKFIVTLDGIKKDTIGKTSVKKRLHGRKTPSPIIFENSTTSSTQLRVSPKVDKNKIPDKLTMVPVPTSKPKEKCKYFPSCRNGEDCEFYHPSRNCEQFPFCKFGDTCLYLHPSCKFGTSCTKRGCPYSHSSYFKQATRTPVPIVPVKIQSPNLQICKYFPNCININCSFYHPKPCKFGKYCKNRAVCNYTHSAVPNKNNLTWKSK